MKKILKYGLMTCVLGMMFSCADELKLSQSAPYNPGWTFEDGIEIKLGFPEMQKATTSRAMDVDEPVLEDLDVFLFVFDGNSLKQTIHIPAADTELADGDTHPGLTNHIKFTAYLPQTDNNTVIHIVALDDASGEFAQQIDAVGYGLEDAIMPKFNVSGNQDAYWQRIDLGCPIICSVDNSEDDGLEDVVGTEKQVGEKLALVQMVRNFACVQLTIAPEVNNFTVLGWTIVNDLDGGSVTPWYSPTGRNDILYPNFVVDDKTNGEKKVADYDDLVDQGYPGVSYSGANLRHTLEDVGGTTASAGNNWYKKDEKIYLYDRKVSSVKPLYLLIYGSLNNNPGYYKVSLSNRNTTTGLVTEYNVLRNIQYTIHITAVTAPGYETPAEAAAGPAFNNISGDVTTRSMLQISDGVDMLFVNFVTYVVTQKDQEVQFMYRYLENILKNNGKQNNGFVEWNAVDDSNPAVDGHGGHFSTLAEAVGLKTQFHDPNAVVTEIGIKTGDDASGKPIYSWTQDMTGLVPYDTTDTRTKLVWKTMKLRFVEPTEELKEQKFVVYTPPQTFSDGTSSVGLSRIINLVVRVPWDYERVRIYPGEWNGNYQKFPDWRPSEGAAIPTDEGEIYIGPNQGDAFVLFFELPSGLPQSMFPMEFIIESDRQNIENAGVDNSIVRNGESLFKDDLGVNDLRIQYVKTVLWDEYMDAVTETSTPATRLVRARFVTTTNMSSYPANITQIVTTVRIHNPAFNDVDYKFTRKKGQAATAGSVVNN